MSQTGAQTELHQESDLRAVAHFTSRNPPGSFLQLGHQNFVENQERLSAEYEKKSHFRFLQILVNKLITVLWAFCPQVLL